ncbi:MAG: class I SAM-dependent methyltransferase [Caulobacterales bacterium]|uniref:class I SAM-dependent methyltransferase n=1 Tax=Glycocaulis sp. TaxID=1969725 RepID=UPI003F9F7000
MSQRDYFKTMGEALGSRMERRLRQQMRFLYRDCDFTGKTVLDIGGGIGLHAFYAVMHGAKSAVVIEPEGDGGHNEMIATFNRLRDALGTDNAELIQTTFQHYQQADHVFDVILVQNAINHFDEPACITLRESAESRASYEAIFRDMASLLAPGGTLVMSDCSSTNFFPAIGLKTNPFDPNIEWHKHQPPSVWAAIAKEHGLEQHSLRWSTPAILGEPGQFLLGSSALTWFFTSHFVLTFRKQAS